MITNRAMEFLNEAYSLLGYFGNDDRARLLVRLAAGEVQELLDSIATLTTARQAQPDGRGVLIVEARAIPALLQERPRADLRALSESILTGVKP